MRDAAALAGGSECSRFVLEPGSAWGDVGLQQLCMALGEAMGQDQAPVGHHANGWGEDAVLPHRLQPSWTQRGVSNASTPGKLIPLLFSIMPRAVILYQLAFADLLPACGGISSSQRGGTRQSWHTRLWLSLGLLCYDHPRSARGQP